MTAPAAPPFRALVVTVSDRSAAGTRPDTGGPLLAELLVGLGLQVGPVLVVADEIDQIQAAVRSGVGRYDLVLTTGGTGLAPRDITPEAVGALLERSVPGLAEALRQHGRDRVPTTILSRAVAGTIGATLVITLAGSPGAVRDAMAVLGPVLDHALAQLRGGGAHR